MNLFSITCLYYALLITTVFSCTPRQKMINYDVSYTYHPDRTMVKNKIIEQKDSLRIYLSYYHPIDFENLSVTDFIKNYKFIFKITKDHSSADVTLSDSILLKVKDITSNANTFYFSFQIPKIQNPALLMLYKKDLRRNRIEVTDISLEDSSHISGKNYLLINQNNQVPILNNFIMKNDTVVIRNGLGFQNSLFVFHYNHSFSPAAPPYILFNSEVETLNIDTSYAVMTNEPLTFKNSGLYFLQKDTNSDDGFSFIVKDFKYPKLSQAEEMIEPLVYLNTEAEQLKLKSSKNPKASLDSFWLRIGGSKEYSKQMIKAFYQKVEYANKMFTSYKEGWKTDRGIIYIIFGKPDQVYKWEDKEEWVYENILTQIVTFNFIKKRTIFSNDHYELVRNESYQQYWFSTIEKWKSGIITK